MKSQLHSVSYIISSFKWITPGLTATHNSSALCCLTDLKNPKTLQLKNLQIHFWNWKRKKKQSYKKECKDIGWNQLRKGTSSGHVSCSSHLSHSVCRGSFQPLVSSLGSWSSCVTVQYLQDLSSVSFSLHTQSLHLDELSLLPRNMVLAGQMSAQERILACSSSCLATTF